MDTRLTRLIREYLAAVESAVSLLEQAGIQRPKSNTEWACSGMPQQGLLAGGVRYFKHGYGCAVHLASGPVDFDFGKEGQINGFDTWRLFGFADDQLMEYGFSSEKELESVFKQAVLSGALVYSGYILHYLATEHGA